MTEAFFSDGLQEAKKNGSWTRKPLLALFANRLKKRVMLNCGRYETCSRELVHRAVEDEVRAMIGNWNSVRGYLILAALQGSVYLGTYKVSVLTHGDVAVTIVVNQIFSQVASILQGPLDLKWVPWLKNFAAKRVGKNVERPKKVDSRTAEMANQSRENYTDAEREGIREGIDWPTNSLSNKINLFQQWIASRRSPVDLSEEEQDTAAIMIGAMLTEMRFYRANIPTRDSEFHLLFRPFIQPTAEWYRHAPIQEKVWAALDYFEEEFARLRGHEITEADRAGYEEFYKKLTQLWFETPAPKLEGRTPSKNGS